MLHLDIYWSKGGMCFFPCLYLPFVLYTLIRDMPSITPLTSPAPHFPQVLLPGWNVCGAVCVAVCGNLCTLLCKSKSHTCCSTHFGLYLIHPPWAGALPQRLSNDGMQRLGWQRISWAEPLMYILTWQTYKVYPNPRVHCGYGTLFK